MVGKNIALSVERAHDIILELDSLRRGDRVIVVWHDACRVTNDPDVRPEYYSTPKETQGTVYDCVPDPGFPNVFYLIISGETTNGKPDYYDAIPVAWIARLTKLEAATKRPKKYERDTGTLTTVHRVLTVKNGRVLRDSGGITKVPLKWMRTRIGPMKFVEETNKIVAA